MGGLLRIDNPIVYSQIKEEDQELHLNVLDHLEWLQAHLRSLLQLAIQAD